MKAGLFIFLVFSPLFLFACNGQVSSQRTVNSEKSDIPLTTTPSLTPLPTSTLTPSATMTMTPTSTPTPVMVAGVALEKIVPETAARLENINTIGHGNFMDYRFLPEQKTFIALTALGIEAYDLNDGTHLWGLQDIPGTTALAVSRDENWIAVGTVDGFIHLIDPHSRAVVANLDLKDPLPIFAGFSWANDRFVSGTVGGNVTVWRVGSWEPLWDYQIPEANPGKAGQALVWAMSRDACYLAVKEADGSRRNEIVLYRLLILDLCRKKLNYDMYTDPYYLEGEPWSVFFANNLYIDAHGNLVIDDYFRFWTIQNLSTFKGFRYAHVESIVEKPTSPYPGSGATWGGNHVSWVLFNKPTMIDIYWKPKQQALFWQTDPARLSETEPAKFNNKSRLSLMASKLLGDYSDQYLGLRDWQRVDIYEIGNLNDFPLAISSEAYGATSPYLAGWCIYGVSRLPYRFVVLSARGGPCDSNGDLDTSVWAFFNSGNFIHIDNSNIATIPAFGGDHIRLNLSTGEVVDQFSLTTSRDRVVISGSSVPSSGYLVEIDTYGKLSGSQVYLVDPNSMEIIWQQPIMAVSASINPDGSRIILSSRDRGMQILNGKTGRLISVEPIKASHTAYSHDGAKVALRTATGWSMVNGQQLDEVLVPEVEAPNIDVWGLGFSPNDDYLIECNQKGLTILEPEHLTLVNEVSAPRGSFCESFVFSPDAQMLSVSFSDGYVRLYDSSNFTELASLPGSLGAVSFSPDQTMIVSAGQGYVRIWGIPAKP